MVFAPEDDGIEKDTDNNGCGEGCVPLIANGAIDSECMLKYVIDNSN